METVTEDGGSCEVKMTDAVTVLTGSRKEIRVTEEEVAEKDMFSVVSYNILADCHMEPQWSVLLIHTLHI